MYKTLTKGDGKVLRGQGIPMDYQRKRRIERDRESSHFESTTSITIKKRR